MENSLLYFFSTVAQVLAASLALFSVFVLFKVDKLKEDIIILSSDIKDTLNLLHLDNDDDIKKKQRAIEFLEKGIQIKNINALWQYFNNDFAYFELKFNDKYLVFVYAFVQRFNKLYSVRKYIITFTLIISSVSSLVILSSLIIIPNKCIFLSKLWLLNTIYTIVFILLLLIFIGLITTIIISLSDNFPKAENKFINIE